MAGFRIQDSGARSQEKKKALNGEPKRANLFWSKFEFLLITPES
jgi:hypothetical protein